MRLDHLLSKEQLAWPWSHLVCGGVWFMSWLQADVLHTARSLVEHWLVSWIG